MAIILEIPYKFPSLNDYVKANRSNKYMGAKMKQDVQAEIAPYIYLLPKFYHPIKIDFLWVESNKRRDLDNICFAKKFILDAMVQCKRLQDDNRRYVVGFSDRFAYGKEAKVVLTIEELPD